MSVAVACAITVVAAIPAVAKVTDSDDHVAPKNKTITFSLKPNTSAQFSTTVDGFAVVVTCTHVTSSFANTTGATAVTVAPPKFTGCKDNLGYSDTVTTNTNNGAWKAYFVDAASDESKKEPAPGDHVALRIPKAGVVVKSSLLTSCTVTSAPKAPAYIFASYDDVNTAKYDGAKIPISGSGCSTSSDATYSATFVYSPGMHDGS